MYNNVIHCYTLLYACAIILETKMEEIMPDNTRLVGWRMPEDLYNQIKRIAYKEGRSFSDMLKIITRNGVRIYLREDHEDGR